MEKKGLIHVYTGDAKGKTTASLGLVLRARGAGWKILFTQLYKTGGSEIATLQRIGVDVKQYSKPHKYFAEDSSSRDESSKPSKECADFVMHAFVAAKKGHYDMLVIDELGPAIACGDISIPLITKLINEKPKTLEIVLTGRGFPKKFMQEQADYCTEMTLRKHPFYSGIQARKGIEF
jgi:cob(I)alamin adenosyltransferase